MNDHEYKGQEDAPDPTTDPTVDPTCDNDVGRPCRELWPADRASWCPGCQVAVPERSTVTGRLLSNLPNLPLQNISPPSTALGREIKAIYSDSPISIGFFGPIGVRRHLFTVQRFSEFSVAYKTGMKLDATQFPESQDYGAWVASYQTWETLQVVAEVIKDSMVAEDTTGRLWHLKPGAIDGDGNGPLATLVNQQEKPTQCPDCGEWAVYTYNRESACQACYHRAVEGGE